MLLPLAAAHHLHFQMHCLSYYHLVAFKKKTLLPSHPKLSADRLCLCWSLTPCPPQQVPILGTPTQAIQHHPASMLEMLPAQVPKDKWVLALLGSSFSQTPGPSRALGFSGNITLGWESLDKRVYSLVAGMHESSSSRCP